MVSFENSPQSRKEILSRLSAHVLNEFSQETVADLIEHDKFDDAVRIILVGIDDRFEQGTLNTEDAAKFYKELGITPHEAIQLRAKHDSPAGTS